MIKVLSERGINLLKNRSHQVDSIEEGMKSFKFKASEIWMTFDLNSEKHFSSFKIFHRHLDDRLILVLGLLEMSLGKKSQKLKDFSLKECEAYLRDRNSKASLENLTDEDEDFFKSFKSFLENFTEGEALIYEYRNSIPFFDLSYVSKLSEFQKFLDSKNVELLYEDCPKPKLLDCEGLNFYLELSGTHPKEKELFEKLHFLSVLIFDSEEVNLIPEINQN